MMSRLFLQAAGLAIAGAALAALPSPSLAATTAAQSTTKACSSQYQAAKAAGTLNGQKWPQFLSDCSARLGTGVAATPATAPAVPAAAAAPAAQPKAKTAAATSGHQTTQQICSTQYQAAKSAGTLGGQKWPQFLKTCRQSIAGDTEDQAAPAEPGPAPVAAAPTAVPSAGGKVLTPGQVAFRQRIHECSVEWQGEKAAGSLPAGSKWPQFWSACNTRLKTQG